MDGAVVRAEPADAGVLAELIAEAFAELAPSRWLIADAEARRQVFPGYFRLYVDGTMSAGVVHTTPDRDAVALWLPISGEPAAAPADYPARLAAVTRPYTARFEAFDTAIDGRHPAGVAHWHLAILAVRPGRQGRGLGSALLRAQHDLLDRAGTPAYLESSSERARALYRRHGYADLGAPIMLPDAGPPMWPMWRTPAHSQP
jgi:GNAT superfamily N-acetyltransferase